MTPFQRDLLDVLREINRTMKEFKVTDHESLQDFRNAQEYDSLCRRIIELEKKAHERIDALESRQKVTENKVLQLLQLQ